MTTVDALGEPPERWTTAPIELGISPGDVFARLHDPVRSAANPYPVVDPAGHRTAGPLSRFDHHVADANRGILYAAERPTGAVAEVYGDGRTIDRLETMHVGYVTPTRPLRLVDVRFDSALAIGATGELQTTSDRRLSQMWARWMYGRWEWADGVAYQGRYAGCLCVAVWERAPIRRTSPSRLLRSPALMADVEVWADLHSFATDR